MAFCVSEGQFVSKSGRLKRLAIHVQALSVAEGLTSARRVFLRLEAEFEALGEAVQMSPEFRQDGKALEQLP